MHRSSLLSIAVVLLVLPPAVARADTVPLPGSMASTGDSITRGFDATLLGCFLTDCPQDSWATGSSSAVNSQYRRVLAADPAVSGHVFNDAKTGAKMSALDAQLATAAGQGVDYVTVLMGANDVCTSSAATMTPTATFQSQFQTALAHFFTARPGAHVFVSSIPDIYQLWSLLHTKASTTWRTLGICQSMLSTSDTEAQRQAVLAREEADNAALASVCGQFANCLWDGGKTFGYAFRTTDVSTVDYFHPSVTGQATLAALSWAAGYWPTTP
jgi:lysophospholipase L1-like esterase